MRRFSLSGWRPGHAAWFFGLCSLLLSGCKQPPNEAATGAAAQASAGACSVYAERICEKAGPETPTCTSFKTAVELMSPPTCQAGLRDVEHSLKRLSTIRGPCESLVKQLCTAVGPKTEACAMVTAETKQFPVERCKAMLPSVAEITLDLKRMEAVKQPLSAELAARIAKDPAPSLGPLNASVQIVEFSDFECPYCSRAASVVHQIREKYGDRVRIVFRQFPLEMHPNAHLAAQASLAAHAQGKFWTFHDLLFENQRDLDREALDGYAQKAGLDLALFKKSLDQKTFEPDVSTDLKLGNQASVQGTPTMFINGERIENPADLPAVVQKIDQLLGADVPG